MSVTHVWTNHMHSIVLGKTLYWIGLGFGIAGIIRLPTPRSISSRVKVEGWKPTLNELLQGFVLMAVGALCVHFSRS